MSDEVGCGLEVRRIANCGVDNASTCRVYLFYAQCAAATVPSCIPVAGNIPNNVFSVFSTVRSIKVSTTEPDAAVDATRLEASIGKNCDGWDQTLVSGSVFFVCFHAKPSQDTDFAIEHLATRPFTSTL